MTRLRRVLRSAKGATATEYGLILALIAIAIFIGTGALGAAVQQQYFNNSETVSDALN